MRLQWLRRLELKEETRVEAGRLWVWLLMTSISIVISTGGPAHSLWWRDDEYVSRKSN